jgi:hypothetical protein
MASRLDYAPAARPACQFRELAVEIRQILEAMPSDFELLNLADSAGGKPDDESERAFFVYRR